MMVMRAVAYAHTDLTDFVVRNAVQAAKAVIAQVEQVVGKTTTTKNIARAAVEAGLNVLVLDMDTQQNATNWGRRREKQEKSLPLVKFSTEQDLPEELKRAAKAGCDLVVIDTPPGRSSEAMAAVEAADLVLVPFWNDQDTVCQYLLKTAKMFSLCNAGD